MIRYNPFYRKKKVFTKKDKNIYLPVIGSSNNKRIEYCIAQLKKYQTRFEENKLIELEGQKASFISTVLRWRNRYPKYIEFYKSKIKYYESLKNGNKDKQKCKTLE